VDRHGLDAGVARWSTAAAVLLGLSCPRVRTACAVAAFGLAAGAGLAARLDAATRDRPRASLEATFEGRVVARAAAFGEVEAELADVVAAGDTVARLPGRVVVRDRGDGGPLAAALPGDRLRVRARLRPPEARANPGSADRTRELARRGIGAVGTLSHPDLVARIPEREGARPLEALQLRRAHAIERLRGEGVGGALAAALALGDRGGLDASWRDAFRQLGLTHLLSVSGLHLALVGALAFRAALPATRRTRLADARRGALAMAVGAAGAYALAAGFEVPVQRSLAMLAALALAVAAQRPVRRAAPLVCAAIAILATDPAALFDAGAQMSFLATAALVFALRPAASEPSRGPLAALFDASALATAATTPIAAAAIGVISPWGLVANALAVPWTGFVLLPASLVAAVAALWDGTAARALVSIAARLGAISLDALRFAAAHAPDAWEARPHALAVVAALVVALAALRARRTSVRVALAVGASAGLALAPPPRVDPPVPRLVALDVGQGDASLVQGRSATVLVDAGTALPGGADLGRTAVVPALRALGVARLDVAVASHADLDHRGGLVTVLERIETERLWLPAGARSDAAFASLIEVAERSGVRVEERRLGDAVERVGDLAIETLWPSRDASSTASRNDRSLVLRIAVGDRAVLLPGDLEADAERALLASGARLHADVVKLAHHGSRTSSTAELLRAAGGAVAIASAPRFGRFGMPHAEVVARAREAGYAVWWTGRDGAVLVSLGPVLWVRGWR
jgi:competence protein ComEC